MLRHTATDALASAIRMQRCMLPFFVAHSDTCLFGLHSSVLGCACVAFKIRTWLRICLYREGAITSRRHQQASVFCLSVLPAFLLDTCVSLCTLEINGRRSSRISKFRSNNMRAIAPRRTRRGDNKPAKPPQRDMSVFARVLSLPAGAGEPFMCGVTLPVAIHQHASAFGAEFSSPIRKA